MATRFTVKKLGYKRSEWPAYLARSLVRNERERDHGKFNLPVVSEADLQTAAENGLLYQVSFPTNHGASRYWHLEVLFASGSPVDDAMQILRGALGEELEPLLARRRKDFFIQQLVLI